MMHPILAEPFCLDYWFNIFDRGTRIPKILAIGHIMKGRV